MGLDEALLRTSDPRPCLRLYTWSPATLSLGYFQRYAEVPAARTAPAAVRRLTGGGAILHAQELTFSITAAQEHPLYAGPVADSYERVHGLLARALERFEVAPSLRGAQALSSEREGTGMCFHHSTALDLVWDGRKGVGSAQRRRDGRVLHHGSIKLAAPAEEEGVAELPAAAGDVQRVARAIVEQFEAELDVEFALEEPSTEELAMMEECGPGYSALEFVRRR